MQNTIYSLNVRIVKKTCRQLKVLWFCILGHAISFKTRLKMLEIYAFKFGFTSYLHCRDRKKYVLHICLLCESIFGVSNDINYYFASKCDLAH